MKTPHKHAELIKAWADGAVIQYYTPRSIGIGVWTDVLNNNPTWCEAEDYRIKPENTAMYGFVGRYKDTFWSVHNARQDNVMATFGPAGNLLSIEIIK
jgi:hypothetical protein